MEAMTAGRGMEPGGGIPPAASVASVAGEGVEAVRAKVARLMMKAPARGVAGEGGAIDLARVGYGLVSATSSGVTHSTMLVDAEDWSKLGCVVSRSRRKRGCKTGYLRAELADGRAYEAFAPREREGVTVLLRDGVVIGWWSVPVFTCEGRMGVPLARELWLAGSGERLGPRRVGVIDSANLLGGCAVLELDPDGGLCVPLRVKSSGLI